MKKEKQLALLTKIDKEHPLDKYTLPNGKIDFINFYKNRYSDLCYYFGKKPKQNECEEVAEQRETLIVALYNNRINKDSIDLTMEKRSRNCAERIDKYNDKCIDILETMLEKR